MPGTMSCVAFVAIDSYVNRRHAMVKAAAGATMV